MPYEVGTRCWYPSKEQGWTGAEISKHEVQGDKFRLELTLENGEKVDLLVSSLDEAKEPSLPLLRNPPILETTEDLTSLSYLNEPAVLHAIKARYAQLNIYTYSGIVLIATNPFDRVDQLYSQEMIQAYAGKRRGELDPHLFAIAEEAYRLMKTTNENQTIIVSGESGAGKTVSAKYIMRYFASVEENNEENAHHNPEMSETEKRILATNPIMEAFGNAKTTRNDNSSRFGKYLEILFDDETSIIGARVRTYLLERSRLVFQPKTERNYHIFYQILSGLSDEEKSQLKLTKVEDYHYMNQGGDYHIQGIDDAEEYRSTVDALTMVGIEKETQFQLFKILAALLHIGNIEIKKVRNDASLTSDEPNLQIAAELLGIDASEFSRWVTKKQIITRSEKIVSNLSYHQAIVSRDSVAKFIYSALFDWLVDNINKVLCNPEVVNEINTFIGVLDIYGFEHFKKNSFEQFCINYANEKLQQEFNQHVFKLEQEEYVKEQIEWSFIEFNDNQPCIDLIENKLGILSLLDEESRLPAGTDEGWTHKLYETLDKPPTNKVFSKPRFGETQFVVSHYALDVTYDVEGFIEKNRDTVSDGHMEVLKSSKNETLLSILETIDKNAEKLAKQQAEKQESQKKPGPVARKIIRKPTLGSMFKQSLIELMETINSTNVHYIRCIKPNEDKEAWKFDNLMVLSQLRACGVLETIRISCAGFPSRWTYTEFALRYHILIPSEYWSNILQSDPSEDDVKNLCKEILKRTMDDVSKYQTGNTKIFFKAGMLAHLEKLRSDKLYVSSVLIQKKIKGVHYRRRYLETVSAIRSLQSASRGLLIRQSVDHEFKTNCSLLIQSTYRGISVRKNVSSTILGIIRIQSLARRKITKDALLERRKNDAAIFIQKKLRSFQPRKQYIHERKSSVTIQSFIRKHYAQRKLKQLKSEAKSVNHLQEVSYKLENKVIELTESLAAKVRENKDLASRLEELQQSLNESENIKKLLETEKETHSRVLNDQKSLHQEEFGKVNTELLAAKEEITSAKLEIEELQKKQKELKDEVASTLEQLNATRLELSTSQTENVDLKKEISSLKEKIARLQSSGRAGGINVGANAMNSTPVKNRRFSSHSALNDASSPKQLNVVSINNSFNTDDVSNLMSKINDELYKMFEDSRSLNTEIIEGLLKGGKVPPTGVSIDLTRKEVLYPARVLIIILSDMWRLGLTKQSETFLAEVLETIQKIISSLKPEVMIEHGAFWFTNVRELHSFVVFAYESITTDETYNSGMNEEEYNEYVNLVKELKDDFEALSFNVYNLWMKKLRKYLEKIAVPAVVVSQALPGFVVPEPSQFLQKFLQSSSVYKMDDVLTFFNNIYWAMKSYDIEMEVFDEVITNLLRLLDALCFNDLILRKGFLSWKRGLQLNYNVTRIEEWCKSHHIPEASVCLQHILQAAKLLQLKKRVIADIDIIWDVCNSLKPIQIKQLITQYSVADYEEPIAPEILQYVAEKVRNDSSKADGGNNDVFLPVDVGPFDDPYQKIEVRAFGQIEAYIPAWLNLPNTRRIVELVTQYVAVQEQAE
ncbi:myosin-2 [Kluyveromyces marxianus]|uniref:Myosin-2 n=2 Tax=Kluyveromyces marxianus TaxID=4911 RepID=W0TAV5_KLUMD|nr:myosin-2 [Kluyveromyces marxianus DMKU3-1042]QGN16496.1 myosin-2 [Kluyveromyces marxianus]BAO40767.1 myosin-2 [Kluyveromyces marxianus DMKU3-1042]BAP72239.1 myosin-2 [Kluyveromyces marxianus]